MNDARWKMVLLFSKKKNAEIVRRWLKTEHGVDVAIEPMTEDTSQRTTGNRGRTE